tara:strand:- start:1204 stop:2943 length:1740 start_codon:yes stop_codon:yes gene_type:complete
MRVLTNGLLFVSFTFASESRIMTYNLLNFTGDDNAREGDLQMIIDAIAPDIIVAQEIDGNDGYEHVLSDVLDPIDSGLYEGAPFTDQNNTNIDIALFYKPEKFTFISTSTINTTNNWGNRDVIEFIMLHNTSQIEIRFYGLHFKAGTGDDNETERAEEAGALRDHLNGLDPEDYFIALGDFNLYHSGEEAWQRLTESQDDNDGRLSDPINQAGNWHNNSAYDEIHTQSSRGYYNGQNYGGLDDRFDFILSSANILAGNEGTCYYIQDTYTSYGNDGNHFNEAVNDGSNTAVSGTIANALVEASDHLPVYMDLWFDDLEYSDEGIVITEVMPNPSAVSDSYGEWIEIHNTTDSTIDIEGWMVMDSGSDEHLITNDAMSILVQPGEYFILANNSDPLLNGGLSIDYVYSGYDLSNSDDEIILADDQGRIVDEVHYINSWPFSSGISMEMHSPDEDNSQEQNWYASSIPYGDGDLGTPGVGWDGTVDISTEIELPSTIHLLPCYPNPFNPHTIIRFEIYDVSDIELQIYDVAGKFIGSPLNGRIPIGLHQVSWTPENNTSGVYFIHLISEDRSKTQKVIFLK